MAWLKRWPALLVMLAAALITGIGVWAFWTTGGTGTAFASVGTLAPPTQVTGSSTAGTGVVSLAWTGVTAPDGGAVDGYYVQRSGTTSGPACGSESGSLLPAVPTSCADTGLSAGTYTYVVVAVFRTWTATSSPSSSVTVVTDVTPPTVSSIERAAGSPTSAASVQWTVTFSESVAGVDTSDFALAASGVIGAAVTSVSGSGSTYTVTAGTGSGNGTLGLNLVDDDSIVDTAGNPLGGSGAGNDNFTGAVYSIDKTPPSTPTLTLSAASGNTYISGSTVYTNPQAGKSGSFQLQATSSDAESGIQKVSFPSLTGYSAGGGDDSSSPYLTTYSWSGSGASASGSQTVSASNNAGLSSSASFTVSPDTTAPSVPAPTVSGGYVNSLSVPVSLGAASDGGSGVDASTLTLQRDQASLSGGSCATFPDSWSTTITLSGGNDTSVASATATATARSSPTTSATRPSRPPPTRSRSTAPPRPGASPRPRATPNSARPSPSPPTRPTPAPASPPLSSSAPPPGQTPGRRSAPPGAPPTRSPGIRPELATASTTSASSPRITPATASPARPSPSASTTPHRAGASRRPRATQP